MTDQIRHTLSTSPDRHYLATICAATDLDLPDDLIALVTQVLASDPLRQRVENTLGDMSCGLAPVNESTLATLIQQILDRPDNSAFQMLLADDILDFLFDDEKPAPPGIRDKFALVCTTMARHLPDPSFAPVFLAHAIATTDPQEVRMALRDCWTRAVHLDDETLCSLAVDITSLVDDAADTDLASETLETALRLIPTCDPQLANDLDCLSHLHIRLIVIYASTNKPAAYAYADTILNDQPAFEATPIADWWFADLLGRIAGAKEGTPAEIGDNIAELEAHPHRWPKHDIPMIAGASIALARYYLAANQPERARPWITGAHQYQTQAETSFPGYCAELAMLTVEEAHLSGDIDRMEAKLRKAARFVKQADEDDYRLRWAILAQAISSTYRDDQLSAAAAAVIAQVTDGNQDTVAGYHTDELRRNVALQGKIMEIHGEFSAGRHDQEIYDDITALCGEIPVEIPTLHLGAHLMAAFIAATRQDTSAVESHLEHIATCLDQVQGDSPGGFAISMLEYQLNFIRLETQRQRDGITETLITEVEQVRNEYTAKSWHLQSYLTTRTLMSLHTSRGRNNDTLREGIRALSFHTKRTALVPDTRERAIMRDHLHTVAEMTLCAAVQAGNLTTAAELLEVIRAQPIPAAPNAHSDHTHDSFMNLATGLLLQEQPPHVWSGTWSPTEPITEPDMKNHSLLDEAPLLLSGLPTIRMPWGVALHDALRDPNPTVGEVEVAVLRGDPGI
ncbi:MAG: hypothetical protein ACK5MT_03570 [Actinomycetales bacterium]